MSSFSRKVITVLRDSNTRGHHKVPCIFKKLLVKICIPPLSLILEILAFLNIFQWQSSELTSILKAKTSSPAKGWGDAISHQTGIHLEKNKSTFIFTRKVRNRFKTFLREMEGCFMQFGFDILTQTGTPVPEGFSRLQLFKTPEVFFLQLAHYFCTWSVLIQKAVMEAPGWLCSFLTCLC